MSKTLGTTEVPIQGGARPTGWWLIRINAKGEGVTAAGKRRSEGDEVIVSAADGKYLTQVKKAGLIDNRHPGPDPSGQLHPDEVEDGHETDPDATTEDSEAPPTPPAAPTKARAPAAKKKPTTAD